MVAPLSERVLFQTPYRGLTTSRGHFVYHPIFTLDRIIFANFSILLIGFRGKRRYRLFSDTQTVIRSKLLCAEYAHSRYIHWLEDDQLVNDVTYALRLLVKAARDLRRQDETTWYILIAYALGFAPILAFTHTKRLVTHGKTLCC